MKKYAMAAFALAAMMVAGGAAQAGVIDPYSSTAGAGNSGTDAFGNTWNGSTTYGAPYAGPGAGFSAWGSPGLGSGDATYGTAPAATQFTVRFAYDSSTAIDQTLSPFPGGYNEYTRFTDDSTGVAWTPTYFGEGVTFTAPTGDSLKAGDSYFANVVFTGSDLSGANAGFTASFGAVPEPASWALMLAGVGLLGGALRGQRRADRKREVLSAAAAA